MNLLGVITTGPVCSVAASNGERVVARESHETRAHASTVLPMVAEVLGECALDLASLDAIAFGRGPGSFTGVRIAASVAQGLALAVGLRLAPISDLAVLAQGAIEAGHSDVVAAVDARMGQVYVCAYRTGPDGTADAVLPEAVASPTDVEWPERPCFGVGSAFAAHPALRRHPRLRGCDADAHARAVSLIALARRPGQALVDPEQALPVYLRDNVASPN